MKRIFAAIVALATTISLGACSNNAPGQSQNQFGTTESHEVAIGEYLQKNSKVPLLWVVVDGTTPDKEMDVREAFVFKDGKVKSYNFGDEDRIDLTLGELAKLDTKEAIQLLEENYYSKLRTLYQNKLEYWRDHEVADSSDLMEDSVTAEDKQKIISELESFKSVLDSHKLKSFPYSINLETDSSGNFTSIEHINFDTEQIYVGEYLYEGSGTGFSTEEKEMELTYTYFGENMIYDTPYAVFSTEMSDRLVLLSLKHETAPYPTLVFDEPDTKLENVTID
ncbi:TPA: hypothetical protein ACGO4F_001741 [Streptococcus suis]|nr:hypothetical protein [Streptococcus suis]